MTTPDDIAAINRAVWDQEAAAGGVHCVPWLDLDVRAIRQFIAGQRDTARWPRRGNRLDECDRLMLRDVAGQEVLCLGAGGGQQSALLGLLGAKVTILDLSEAQLSGDRRATEHYGYPLRIVQGDMRDLSAFTDNAFDRVEQPISICFVPDVRTVYRQVARVLRSKGLYRVAHVNPATYPVCFAKSRNGWDGVGYRIAEPYRGGAIRINDEGTESMGEGKPTGEFRHLLSDIFNGLTEAGLVIRGVWEDTRHLDHVPDSKPGSEAHQWAHVADYFRIIAQKGSA